MKWLRIPASVILLALPANEVQQAAAIGASNVSAGELVPDANTLMLLHFDNTLNGEQGETPTQASGVSFETGIFGNGARFASGNQVYYLSSDNLIATSGTLEFWIKPEWGGNDGQGHVVLRWGNAGGIYFAKDGGNYWRSIFNRFAAGGNPELGTGIEVSAEWQSNQWHHGKSLSGRTRAEISSPAAAAGPTCRRIPRSITIMPTPLL